MKEIDKMEKYKEAFEFIANNHNYLPDDDKDWLNNKFERRLGILKHLVDKEDKYTWHNLKANKYDLPKQCELVLCDTKDGYMIMYIKGHWWMDDKDGYTYANVDRSDGIVAWKYIEPFE